MSSLEAWKRGRPCRRNGAGVRCPVRLSSVTMVVQFPNCKSLVQPLMYRYPAPQFTLFLFLHAGRFFTFFLAAPPPLLHDGGSHARSSCPAGFWKIAKIQPLWTPTRRNPTACSNPLHTSLLYSFLTTLHSSFRFSPYFSYLIYFTSLPSFSTCIQMSLERD